MIFFLCFFYPHYVIVLVSRFRHEGKVCSADYMIDFKEKEYNTELDSYYNDVLDNDKGLFLLNISCMYFIVAFGFLYIYCEEIYKRFKGIK